MSASMARLIKPSSDADMATETTLAEVVTRLEAVEAALNGSLLVDDGSPDTLADPLTGAGTITIPEGGKLCAVEVLPDDTGDPVTVTIGTLPALSAAAYSRDWKGKLVSGTAPFASGEIVVSGAVASAWADYQA